MSWKRMKGILGDLVCSKCGGRFHDNEFDEQEDMCHYCLFDGVSGAMPVGINHRYGDERNITPERELLDNLDHTPIKKTDKENKRKRDFQYKLAEKRKHL